MNRQYSILQAPVLAFFSGRFYDDVARRWRGIAFWYLFLLLAATWLIVAIKVYLSFSQYMATHGQKFIAQVPAVSIRDGAVTIDKPSPYEIRDPKSQEVVAVLDPEGKLESLEQYPHVRLLLTEKQLVTFQNKRETRTYDLSDVKQFDMDAQSVQRWVNILKGPGAVLFYGVCLAWSLAYRLVQVLIFGALALGFASMLNRQITFAAGVRLAVMAVSTVILLDTVLNLAGVSRFLGCAWWPICLGIELAYLGLGVSAVGKYDSPSEPGLGFPAGA